MTFTSCTVLLEVTARAFWEVTQVMPPMAGSAVQLGELAMAVIAPVATVTSWKLQSCDLK